MSDIVQPLLINHLHTCPSRTPNCKKRSKRLADNARAAAAPYVIRQIKQAVSFYQLTVKDLDLNSSAERLISPAGRPASEGKALVAPSRGVKRSKASAKFRNAEGQEWGGRGPRPQWPRTALSEGRLLSDFQVGPGRPTRRDKPSATALPTSAPAAAAPEGRSVKAEPKKQRSAKRSISKPPRASGTTVAKKTVARGIAVETVLPPPSVLPSLKPKPGKRTATSATLALQPKQTDKKPTNAGGVKKKAFPATKTTPKKATRKTSAKAGSKKSLKPSSSANLQSGESVRQLEGHAEEHQADQTAATTTSSKVENVPAT